MPKQVTPPMHVVRRVFGMISIPFVAALGAYFLAESLALVQEAALAAQKKADAQSRPQVFRGARILTAAGREIANGILVVHQGKILALGAEGDVGIPENALVRDMKGKVLIPGLVDTHSHIGVFSRPQVSANQDGNEMTGPVQPGLRALDAVNPDDPGIRMALAGGVTTANIMPGSGNAVGGQTLYVKLKGITAEAMRILVERVLGGIKFANGENPKGAYGGKGAAPATRMKIAALQREILAKAQAYKRQWENFEKNKGEGKSPPERDLNLEPLVEVLNRKRTVHFHCHRADDIMTAIRLADEFGFELVLQHCTEGYRVADEIAKRGIIVSLTLLDSPGGKPEAMGLLEENAAILTKAGVKVCINTDDFITESRFLLRTGAIAVRGGMSEEAALKAITLHGAQAMHLDHRLGSLEIGKDADFVVLSGRPFSVYTQVLETYIEGERVFNRDVHADWTYQAGGFALSDAAKRLPTPAILEKEYPSAPLSIEPKNSRPFTGAPKKFAVLAGRIHPVSGPAITKGVILVEDGKISQIGKQDEVVIPQGLPVLTANVVTPGLIDTHSVVGLSGVTNVKKADQDQDETSDPNQADLRVLDSFNPQEPLLQFIREQGVTIVHAMPGRANVIAGQTGIFRTQGRTAEQMAIRFPAGMLINLGEVPKSTYSGKFPNTRMGTANMIRTALAAAESYSKKKATSKDPVTPNMKSEGLLPVLQQKIPVIFAAHRADDLMTGVRLADEFKIKPMLALGTEAYLLADTLQPRGIPVLVHPTMQRPSATENFNSILGNASVLADHKIPMAITTAFEGYVPKTRVLRYEAAMAMVNGLGYDRALRSITLDAAKILGIDDRFGSLDAGKVADMVLYDGDPFEHFSHVTHTIMNGRLIYDRADYLKLPFERRVLPFIAGGSDFGCCLGVW